MSRFYRIDRWVINLAGVSLLLLVAVIAALVSLIVHKNNQLRAQVRTSMQSVATACRFTLTRPETELLDKVTKQLEGLPECASALKDMETLSSDYHELQKTLKHLPLARLPELSDAVLGPSPDPAATSQPDPNLGLVSVTRQSNERIREMNELMSAVFTCNQAEASAAGSCVANGPGPSLAKLSSNQLGFEKWLKEFLDTEKTHRGTQYSDLITKLSKMASELRTPDAAVAQWLGALSWSGEPVVELVEPTAVGHSKTLTIKLSAGEGVASQCHRIRTRVYYSLKNYGVDYQKSAVKNLCSNVTGARDVTLSCTMRTEGTETVVGELIFDFRMRRESDQSNCYSSALIPSDFDFNGDSITKKDILISAS